MVPSPNDIAIFLPLAVALATILATIGIHALAVMAVVQFVRRERRIGLAGIRFWTDVSIVAVAALFALAALFTEITVWAVVIGLCAGLSKFSAAFYHSAMIYTTLGYDDGIYSPNWKLLGPLESADGMLMFGVTTGMIFAVIQRLVQPRFD